MKKYFSVWAITFNGEKINVVNHFEKEDAEQSIKNIMEKGYFQSAYYEEVEGYECPVCNDLIEDEEDLVDTRDGYVCRCCYENYYHACHDCDEIFHEDELYYSEHINGSVCHECYSEYYTTCVHCDVIVPRDDSYYVDYVGSVCDGCFYDRYSICDHCREIYRNEEVSWCESVGADLCDYCRPQGIMGYSYEPKLIFRSLPDEDKPLYLGIELEVDEGGKSDENACTILAVANDTEEEHIVIKEDGSIPYGFEIASQPCSYEYHMSSFPWKSILNEARSLGYRSHDTSTCGLHVHVDRKYFGDTEEEREKNIAKLVLLVELFKEQMKKVGRRDGNTYAKYITDSYAHTDSFDLYSKAKSVSRYHAINLQNSHTVELRFFRGTLKHETFMATLQFVKYLVDYSISQSLERIENGLTWEEFISVIPSHYTYLVDYLKKRQLWYAEEREVVRV